jgi:uncharacterized protein (DUF4415 family)
MDKPEYIIQEDWDSVDSPELPEGFFKNAMSADEVLPKAFMKAWRNGEIGVPTSKSRSIRLAPDIVTAFQATGEGWEQRINDVLRNNLPR